MLVLAMDPAMNCPLKATTMGRKKLKPFLINQCFSLFGNRCIHSICSYYSKHGTTADSKRLAYPVDSDLFWHILDISVYSWLLLTKWLIDSINTSINTVGSKELRREVPDHPAQPVISGGNVTESHL